MINKNSTSAIILVVITLSLICSCHGNSSSNIQQAKDSIQDTTKFIVNTEDVKTKYINPNSIKIEKALLYDKHTLDDSYPYKDTVRSFQWMKIRQALAFVDSIYQEPSSWAVLQNYKNLKGEAPLVRNYKRNEYTRISDSLGVERYQSVPLYFTNDTITPEYYGRDGWLVNHHGEEGSFEKVSSVNLKGEWLAPKKYVKQLSDSIHFKNVIVVDVLNQNIMTLEKSDSTWYIRSMNPATTGRHKPPHMQETPTGIFVIQEKKPKMFYLVDGTTEIDGFAPYASRFTNGAYIHGVPLKAPNTDLIEFSPTLGTIPRSHMCVRNATSHAKFVYDWAPILSTLIFVID